MNLKRLFFWAFIFSVLLGYVLLTEKKPVEKKELTDNTKLIKACAKRDIGIIIKA